MKTERMEEKNGQSICCSWSCSGQLNETCGGDLCNSVYAINDTLRRNFSEYLIKNKKIMLLLIASANSVSPPKLSLGCRSNPCSHGGTCIENRLISVDNSYQCRCVPGRIGNNCEYRE